MKIFNLGLAGLCIALSFSATAQDTDDEWTTGEVEVKPFSRLIVKGGLDVDITVGDTHEVIVETLNMPNDAVFIKQRGNTLVAGIHWRNLLKYAKNDIHVDTEVKITVPSLEYLQIKHAGESTLEGTLVSDALTLKIGGASDLIVDRLEVEKLKVRVRGAGTLRLAGTATEQKVRVRGASSYYASNLATDYTDVRARGASDAEVLATDWLKATARGAADIYYFNDPKTTDAISKGASDIVHKRS
ncbi:MAG: head GIN domain-containing protein [Bacteroidota bacterium]